MKRQLTYKISKYSTYLKADEVDSEIARAFRVWETVTDFTFVRSDSDEVEIEIRCCRSTATEVSSFSYL
jgi:matrix metalloproteinase-14 (membrane-inserted)